MDAFKELQKRAPDVSLMDLTDLHSTVFWSGAAYKIIQTKIETAREMGGMQSQVDAWLSEAQAITEHKVRAQQRLGEIAKDTKKTTVIGKGKGTGLGTISSGEPLKWERLGFKSKTAMKDAEFLSNNPKAVDEAIDEAKDSDDVISTGAIKNKVRAKKAEETLSAERKQQRDKPKPALDSHLEWCIQAQSEINVKLSAISENIDQVDPVQMHSLAILIRRAAELMIKSNDNERQIWQKLITD